MLAKRIANATAKQVAGVAAQKLKPLVQRVPLGSAGSAFLDGGFGKTGKAGYGGVKRIALTSASNFKAGMKIQIIGTVYDLYGDMTKVFGENGSDDLSEFLGRASVSLVKAGTTAALGSLFAAGAFAAAGAVATAVTVPVWVVAFVVVGGYIAVATAVDLVDAAIDGKERVAQWAK